MGSFVRGSVASFRISDDFNQGHLDYLNASGGSKSTRLAKYCSIGLKAEMDESIIINASGLPVHVRDWLSKSENVELLVIALSSSKLNHFKQQEAKHIEGIKSSTEVPLPINRTKSIENTQMESDDALNDFIQQLKSL